MSEKLLPESAPIDEGTPEYQRNKGMNQNYQFNFK